MSIQLNSQHPCRQCEKLHFDTDTQVHYCLRIQRHNGMLRAKHNVEAIKYCPVLFDILKA